MKLTIDTRQLNAKLRTLPHFIQKEGFPIMAQAANEEILEMTSANLLADGTVNKALSPAYAKFKQKVVGNTNPNFRLFGNLLPSLHYSPSERKLLAGDDQTEKVQGLNAMGRPLFRTSKAMAIRAKDAVADRLQRFLQHPWH